MQLKNIYQKSYNTYLQYTQWSLIKFNTLQNNVKGMESPKELIKQFESFKSKLKFKGLFFLQDHIQTLISKKKEK